MTLLEMVLGLSTLAFAIECFRNLRHRYDLVREVSGYKEQIQELTVSHEIELTDLRSQIERLSSELRGTAMEYDSLSKEFEQAIRERNRALIEAGEVESRLKLRINILESQQKKLA